MGSFVDWLSATPLSEAIRDVPWIIPAVQTIHILALAIALSSTLMFDSRLTGFIRSDAPIASTAARFLPWTWRALAVLAISGIVLIIGEPARELPNPAFQAKMALLAGVVILAVWRHRTLNDDAPLRALSPAKRIAARSTAALSILMWIAIATAGRWIAYVDEL